MAAAVDARALTERLKAKAQEQEFSHAAAQELKAQGIELNYFHYNVLMSSRSRRGHWQASLEWLRNLQQDLLRADGCSVNTAIASCKSLGIWTWAVNMLHAMTMCALRAEDMGVSSAIGACQGPSFGLWRRAWSLWSVAPTQSSTTGVLKTFQQSFHWPYALWMLEAMPTTRMKPDLINYNSIAGNCQVGNEWQKTMLLLSNAPGFDDVALNYMAKAAAGGAHWQAAMELGNAGVLLGCTAALSACSQATAWESATLLLLAIGSADAIACNAGLGGCRTKWERTFALLDLMAFRRIAADETSLHLQIQSFELMALWEMALQSLCSMQRISLRQGVFSMTSTLSTMSVDAASNPWEQALSLARSLVDAAVRQNIATYSAASQKAWQRCINLIGVIPELLLEVDTRSCVAALQPTAKATQWMSAINRLDCMHWNWIRPDTTCLNILSNCIDQWQLALGIFWEMPSPDLMSLNAAMSMCDQFDISLGRELLACYPRTTAQSAASLVWAMARMTVQDPHEIQKALAQVWSRGPHDLGTRDLPKLYWAMGMLGVSPKDVLRLPLDECLEQLSNL
ncbi:Hypothetical protein (Fragment), partial [Durusdinium trenchii]